MSTLSEHTPLRRLISSVISERRIGPGARVQIMRRHLAVQSGWRMLVDRLYGGPAGIDLMMVVVQDSDTQFVGPDGQHGREGRSCAM